MNDRFYELFGRYVSDHSIAEANKMAREKLIDELLHEIRNQNLTSDQKLDRVVEILVLMKGK
jgi:hypothetical protein